jgi:hypothetical protein
VSEDGLVGGGSWSCSWVSWPIAVSGLTSTSLASNKGAVHVASEGHCIVIAVRGKESTSISQSGVFTRGGGSEEGLLYEPPVKGSLPQQELCGDWAEECHLRGQCSWWWVEDVTGVPASSKSLPPSSQSNVALQQVYPGHHTHLTDLQAFLAFCAVESGYFVIPACQLPSILLVSVIRNKWLTSFGSLSSFDKWREDSRNKVWDPIREARGRGSMHLLGIYLSPAFGSVNLLTVKI